MIYFSNFMFRLFLAATLASLISACGGGGSSQSTYSSDTTSIRNVQPLVVDSGPTANGANMLFTTVTICQPGNAVQCQTVDHIQVDTGSTGLRVLASALSSNMQFSTSTATGPSGFTLLNCAQFADSTYAWGRVARADMIIGAEKAANVPIQIMGESAYNSVSGSCSGSGTLTELSSVAALGAKGILGIGFFKEDCGSSCASNAANGFYFNCLNAACTSAAPTAIRTDNQLKHPVPFFATNNNGFVIDLPSVNASGTSSIQGSLIFGINTQSNNQLSAGRGLTTDDVGTFNTQFQGNLLTFSFLDTGSNGLFFDANIPSCPLNSSANGFYCPNSTVNLSAQLVGINNKSAQIGFSVANAVSQFSNSTLSVFPHLAGPANYSQVFDFGLPFYFGRRVFQGIEGQSNNQDASMFYAF